MAEHRIRDTYSKDSNASSRSKLDDPCVKFFRWATDRLGDRDGIVCFVSNNGFLDQVAFDRMRKHLMQDFDRIDHLDLHGNFRRDPKIPGTTHNVFGIQVGVGITLAVRKKDAKARLRYYRVPEAWRKGEKLDFLSAGSIPWQDLAPDAGHTWLAAEHFSEYREFPAITEMFEFWSMGLNTARDATVYDFDQGRLAIRIKKLIEDDNLEADRHRRRLSGPHQVEQPIEGTSWQRPVCRVRRIENSTGVTTLRRRPNARADRAGADLPGCGSLSRYRSHRSGRGL